MKLSKMEYGVIATESGLVGGALVATATGHPEIVQPLLQSAFGVGMGTSFGGFIHDYIKKNKKSKKLRSVI
jgi:hypothetical protein